MNRYTALVYPDLAYSGLQRPAPPYSILFLADALQKAGIDVDIFDLRYDSTDDVLQAVQTREPEYVGISVMTGPQIQSALAVANVIRQNVSNTVLVWGGIHPTILPHQTNQHPLVDVIIRGDGERAFTQLIQGESWRTIQGLFFSKNNQIFDGGLAAPNDMTKTRVPWELIDAQRYVKRGRTSIITSRGCPYRCAFCYNAILRSPWRGWTVKQCISELEQLVALGAEDILFFDDAFFTNLTRVRKLFPYLRKENISWIAELRVDQLTRSLARDSLQAGCKGFFFGAESGSSRILRLLEKKITVSQQLRSAQITHEEGLGADYSWMVGIPTETARDRRLTITAIKAIQQRNPSAEFAIKIYTPYPGTPLYQLAQETGALLPQTLIGWSDISRFRAPYHLPQWRRLEMLALTSTLVGRQMFRKIRKTPFIFIRSLAKLRWRNEYFGLPWESMVYEFFNRFFRERQSRFGLISQQIAKGLIPQDREETFAR